MSLAEKLERFYLTLSEIHRLNGVLALLDWDMHVTMPSGGAASRAAQEEAIARLIHGKTTEPAFVEVVHELFSNLPALGGNDQVNVRETKRIIDRAAKLPDEFVGERSRIAALSYATWVKARAENDFAAAAPFLKKLIDFARQEAELIGYEECKYDALLDGFEPYARLSKVKPLLLNLGRSLQQLIPRIRELQKDGQDWKGGALDRGKQGKLCCRVAGDFGYDFSSGRLDPTAHPFETKIGSGDVRITTRYDEADFLSALYSTMHETGHALYELGLPLRYEGTPRGASISLGIHESQSRFWENIIGRSRSFSYYLADVLKDFLSPPLPEAEALWQRLNRVTPSLIRVEADEVTYSLHVVIRLLLEEELIESRLNVEDLPKAWNEHYEKFLGLRPGSDKDGVLQDVHWYQGAFGYFPTYALGNLYGAMLLKQMQSDLPALDDNVRNGHFQPLRNWLSERIYSHGMKYPAADLIKQITGNELSEQPFLAYVSDKFGLT